MQLSGASWLVQMPWKPNRQRFRPTRLTLGCANCVQKPRAHAGRRAIHATSQGTKNISQRIQSVDDGFVWPTSSAWHVTANGGRRPECGRGSSVKSTIKLDWLSYWGGSKGLTPTTMPFKSTRARGWQSRVQNNSYIIWVANLWGFRLISATYSTETTSNPRILQQRVSTIAKYS